MRITNIFVEQNTRVREPVLLSKTVIVSMHEKSIDSARHWQSCWKHVGIFVWSFLFFYTYCWWFRGRQHGKLLGKLFRKISTFSLTDLHLFQRSTGGLSEDGRYQMAHIYERVLSLVTKPPAERRDNELEDVVPWFKKKADKLFKDIQNQIIKDIVKNAEFRKCNSDVVIVRQGEKGDEFFIMLSGTATVHINSNLAEEEVEAVHRKQLHEEAVHRENMQGKPLDRSLYGVHVTDVCTGKSFGELALINPESTRNATIIASGSCELLVVSRDLYNKTLHAFQAREFAEKQRFVQDFPLFHKWNARYRKMAAMSLVKIIVKFEDTIVKQGMTVDGLHFVISGELKLRVDPSHHPTQYPQHFPVGDIAELEKEKARELLRKEMNLERHKSSGKKSAYERRSAVPVDKKNSGLRPMDLCLMGAIDTIGDLEMVLGLSTYSQTVICMEEATIFHLDQRNYDRLVEKKNPQTVDIMRDIVHTKLTLHFSRLSDDSIPLYRYILYTLDEREREMRELQQQQMRARGRHTPGAYNSETEWQIDNLRKGPLVNLYGPGSVFYLIRMKAKERQQRQQREKATPSGNNAYRIAQQPQTNVFGRTPLADNSRFLYEDDTASISDGHIVNIYGYSDNQSQTFGDNRDYDNTQGTTEGPEGICSEECDWATSDSALSNLEQRLLQWHSSLDSTGNQGTAGLGGGPTLNVTPVVVPGGLAASSFSRTYHSVVKLHRFHADDENRPKPGNKVYVRGRDKGMKLTANLDDPISPEDDKRPKVSPDLSRSPLIREPLFDINSNELPGNFYEEPANLPAPRPDISAGPLWSHTFSTSFRKSQHQRKHQYTKEEYQALKEELRRRQRAYKSFLPQRSGTSLY